MRSAETIKKRIKNTTIKTNPKVNKAVLNDLLDRMDRAEGVSINARQPNIWRIIMNRPISKFATAAAVILIVALGITLLDHSVSPAYAIEQTIEALRQTRIVHMFCRDWNGKEFEMWMSLNAEGYPEYCYSYWPDYKVTNISTPTVSYQYNKKMNRVSISKGKLYHFDIRFDKIFEDLQEAVLKNENNVTVYREAASSDGENLRH